MLPFGLEQLADTAKGTQTDPDCALHSFVDRANTTVFMPGGEGGVLVFQLDEDIP